MRWLIAVFMLTMRLRSLAQSVEVSVEYPVLPATLEYLESSELASTEIMNHDSGPDPPNPQYPVQYAGAPRALSVEPRPLPGADHELMLNVSWKPPLGPSARDYSLEVHSDTDTADCRMTMCYEYNIPGTATWWLIPARASPLAESCAVRPGCAYRVRLIAHPWDGRTAVNSRAQLHECESGVCSCAHARRLPAPLVAAGTVSVGNDLYINVSWTLPPPAYPQRLPKGLQKKSYFVSIGRQMVSDAHPSPWFAHTITRSLLTEGPVATGEGARFLLLPATDKNGQRRDVKLLARVSVVDERGCKGPAGNATAYDPAKVSKVSIATYILWATLGAAIALGSAAVLLGGARAAKRVLRALRPAPADAPRAPPRRAWFALHTALWVSYTQRAYNELRVQYNNAFRVLMGLPRRCSASGMFAEARVDGFAAVVRKRCASLLARVRASPNRILNALSDRWDCYGMGHWIRLHAVK